METAQLVTYGAMGLEEDEAAGRRFRLALAGSMAAHVAVLAFLLAAPETPPLLLSTAITVDLIAELPRPAKPAAAPAKPAAARPPALEKVVLPKQPQPVRAKPPPAKKERAVAPPVAQPQELDYEDALAELRSELGEGAVEPGTEELLASVRAGEPAAVSPGGRSGPVDAELATWQRAAAARVRSVWITPPEFLNRGLRTGLLVSLTSRGDVVGSPVVTVSSGDAYADDNAVRALLKASPLPAPPEPGDWPFLFTPRASR